MQVTGRVTVSINGQSVFSKSGAKANLGGIQRTVVMADQGVAGFKEEPMVPFIEVTMIHRASDDLEWLRDLKDATVSFVTDTDKRYILRNAWHAQLVEITGGEGEVPLRFEGIEMEVG